MWPAIPLGGGNIYMTGLGIVVSLFVFLGVSYYFAHKYKLEWHKLFFWMPVPLIVTYLLGSYVSFFLATRNLIPLSLSELGMLFSPYGYHFDYVGILVGLVVSLRLFFRTIKYPSQQAKWIDTFFFSASASLVPLGLFLLLGDDFVGQVAPEGLGLQPLSSHSEWAKYESVFPVGLYVSLAGLISFFSVGLFKRYRKISGVGYWGFALLVLLVSIVFLFSQYPRHLVILIGSVRFDMRQYLSFALIGGLIFLSKRLDDRLQRRPTS